MDLAYCCDPTCGYRLPTHRTTSKCRESSYGVGAYCCERHACPQCEPLQRPVPSKPLLKTGPVREPRWHAGAIGRSPDDDSLVYRDDAMYGPKFYASSPAEAEVAARLLNELQDMRDARDPCPSCKGVGQIFPLDATHYLLACTDCNPKAVRPSVP